MSEPDEVCPVGVLLFNGEEAVGEFLLWEESPSDQDEVFLGLRFAGREYEESAESFFDALARIRRRLEPDGIFLNCYGCSRNVFPSPMIRAMGSGRKAYRLEERVGPLDRKIWYPSSTTVLMSSR